MAAQGPDKPTLKKRIAALLASAAFASDPIRTMEDFVHSEVGRSKGGGALDNSYPVVLYFPTAADRDGFVNACTDLNPKLVMRKTS